MSEPVGGSPFGVGFIGLGNIGKPMAKRLRDWDGGLTVFDVVQEATIAFAQRGCAVAANPAEVAKNAKVVCLMVRDDAQVEDVMFGENGIVSAGEGTVVVIHSTVEADTPAQLAQRAAEHGVAVIDAPVSGGAMGAHEGTLAIMVGGDDDAVAIARPVLDKMGTMVAHMGGIGAGTRAKLARNLITFVSFAATGEAMALAQAAGVDIAKLGDVVRHSDAITGGPGSVMLRTNAEVMADDDGLRPIFTHTAELGEKDLALAAGLGDELNIDTPLADHAMTMLRTALGIAPA